jgi:hypothetical protein
MQGMKSVQVLTASKQRTVSQFRAALEDVEEA